MNDAIRSGSRTSPARSFCSDEIRRGGLVAQPFQPEQPDARRESLAKLRFSPRIALGMSRGNPARERGIVILQ
jgi:hypothetical protein